MKRTGQQEGRRQVRKVVLAYSGGLDTSVILRWLIETYRCEMVAFVADIVAGALGAWSVTPGVPDAHGPRGFA